MNPPPRFVAAPFATIAVQCSEHSSRLPVSYPLAVPLTAPAFACRASSFSANAAPVPLPHCARRATQENANSRIQIQFFGSLYPKTSPNPPPWNGVSVTEVATIYDSIGSQGGSRNASELGDVQLLRPPERAARDQFEVEYVGIAYVGQIV
jgi:hypothetical protein